MKKYFFVFILFLLMIITVSANGKDNNMLKLENLNSNNLLEYLKDNKINSNRIKICNVDYCDYLKYQNLDKAVKVYIDEYIEFVKEKTDVDTSVRVSLKGFLITEIIY